MELKVGDRIYSQSYRSISGVYTIERVTAKQAICANDVRFIKEYTDSHWIKRVGNSYDKWNNTSYYLETPELKEQLFRQIAIQKLDKFDYGKLSDEHLKTVLSIIGNYK